MKTNRIYWIILLSMFFLTGYSQSIDYKAKTQKLIPEETFLSQADWEALFYDKAESDAVSKYGVRKGVVIAPNETVFVSDRYKFTITILNKQGRVVKTFGKKGGNPGEFVSNQTVEGILDGKYLVVSDAQGRINFFDLDGNFVKMIILDFMPLNIYPLKNGKMIVQGHVPYGTKSKKLLAELDFESEKYTQIYYTFEDYDDPRRGISMPYKDGQISIGPPFSARKPYYRVTTEGKVILGENSSAEVKVFSKENGSYKESGFTIKGTPIVLTQKEKDEYYENFKKRLEEKGMDAALAEKKKQEGFFPDYLPYYYNIIVDEKNNCLFFIYSNEKKDHIFQAYTTEGQYLGESEFAIEGYDLMSGLGSFTFMNGYVYTLALKNGEESPMRILKCRIVSE